MSHRSDRTQWFNPKLDDYAEGEHHNEILVPCLPKLPGLDVLEPNLVSSRLFHEERASDNPFGNWHSPVLDIDFAARLVPSTTEGHHHLYLDGLTMPWPRYRSFLRSLAGLRRHRAGLLRGERAAANELRARLPHVKKPIEL